VAPSTSPVSLQPGWYYDNIVYCSNAPSGVDLRGVEYSAIADGVTSLYDVWFQSGTYYENYTPLTSGTVGSVSPVPLPPALPLFGAAIVGVGLLGWRKQRQAKIFLCNRWHTPSWLIEDPASTSISLEG
jgi:hypothetical protein